MNAITFKEKSALAWETGDSYGEADLYIVRPENLSKPESLRSGYHEVVRKVVRQNGDVEQRRADPPGSPLHEIQPVCRLRFERTKERRFVEFQNCHSRVNRT